MSVRTTSDEKIDEAIDIAKEIIDKINKMNKLFEEAVDSNTWGSNDYKIEFYTKLNKLKLKSVKFQIRLHDLL